MIRKKKKEVKVNGKKSLNFKLHQKKKQHSFVVVVVLFSLETSSAYTKVTIYYAGKYSLHLHCAVG